MNQEHFNLLGQEIKNASMTAEEREKALELETMLKRLEKRRITPSKELPRMEFLFRLSTSPVFPVVNW